MFGSMDRWSIGFVLAICLVFSHLAAPAADFPRALPEEVGLSSKQLSNIDRILESAIQEQEAKGLVVGVVRHGKLVYLKAVGERDSGKPMQNDSIFRICSMTKPITALAAMILFEEGRFTLDEPLSNFIPEFAEMQVSVADASTPGTHRLVKSENEVTIGHLLTHTSGLAYSIFGPLTVAKCYVEAGVTDNLGVNRDVTAIEVAKALATCPLVNSPGSRFEYGMNLDVLGVVIELISGMPLDRFLEQRILSPLGMEDTYFYLPAEKVSRLAAIFAPDGAGGLRKLDRPYERGSDLYPEEVVVMMDPRYPYEGPNALFSGGAGLSSTVLDYLRFCQLLLNGGQLDGVRVISPGTVSLMTSSHKGEASLSFLENWSLQGTHPAFGGLVVDDPALFGRYVTKGTYFWVGYYCTAFDIDFQNDLAYVLMAQRGNAWLWEDHEDDWKRIQAIVHAAVIDD